MFFTKALTFESVKNVIEGSRMGASSLVSGGLGVVAGFHELANVQVYGTNSTFTNWYSLDAPFWKMEVSLGLDPRHKARQCLVYGPFDVSNYSRMTLDYALNQSAAVQYCYYSALVCSTHNVSTAAQSVVANNTILAQFMNEESHSSVAYSDFRRSTIDVSALSGDCYLIFEIQADSYSGGGVASMYIYSAFLEV